MSKRLEVRVTKLEEAVTAHLIQSTGITTAIKNLERAYDKLVGAGITFNILLAMSILGYVFFHK